jgi:hypothetical protein
MGAKGQILSSMSSKKMAEQLRFLRVGAAWIASIINPKTDATVSPAAYVLPTTQPSPTPTAILDNNHSVLLGFDQGSGHTIIFILPGGNGSPVEPWDYVITPPPVSARKN